MQWIQSPWRPADFQSLRCCCTQGKATDFLLWKANSLYYDPEILIYWGSCLEWPLAFVLFNPVCVCLHVFAVLQAPRCDTNKCLKGTGL